MAHELNFRAGRASMAYTGGRTPWHGLGQDMPAGADLAEWQRAAGMDFEILETPAQFVDRDGVQRPYPDRMVLYRDDNRKPLGLVSNQYRVVQPREIIGFFRDLTAERGFTMETAGVLFDGQKYWALARCAPDAFVLDRRDSIKPYLLLTTACDGTMATQARLTTIAVVCNNTLTMATRGRPEVRINHRKAFDEAAVKSALSISAGDAAQSFEQTMATFRQLARAPLGGHDMVRLTLQAFGHDPERMDRKQLEEAAASRGPAMVGTAAMTGQGLLGAHVQGRTPGTAWGWVNAVTQYADHAAKARSQSHRLDSAWFGAGEALKRRALDLAVRYVTGPGGVVTVEQEQVATGSGLLDDVLAATEAQAA